MVYPCSVSSRQPHDSLSCQNSIKCQYCGICFEGKEHVNIKRMIAGHYKHCMSSAKRLRIEEQDISIENKIRMDNNEELDTSASESLVILPSTDSSNLFQLKMIDMYFDNGQIPFTTRNRNGSGQSVCWESYALINGFISDVQLSESKGDQLLELIKDLFKMNNISSTM